MEVKNEMTREINGGSRILVVTPDMGKVIVKKSMASCPPGKIKFFPSIVIYFSKDEVFWQSNNRG
jgi:hypothetical protein